MENIETNAQKLVYFYIENNEPVEMNDIVTELDMKYIHLLPILRSLENEGLVDECAGIYFTCD